MKKLKIPVLILVTLGLLLLFASLPQLASSAMDIRLRQTPVFSDMFSIQLNTDPEQQALTAIDKLAFLSIAEITNTTQDLMTMEENEVIDAVNAFLIECEAAGIFYPFEPSSVSIQPKLHYDLSDPTNHMLVWFVTMLYEGEPIQSLRLDVEDGTGQILCITYGNYQEYEMDGVWERNITVADALTDLYFTQLGLLDVSEEIKVNATDADIIYDYNEVDGGVTEVVYVFEDSAYGEFFVQFTVDGAGGFQTTIFK